MRDDIRPVGLPAPERRVGRQREQDREVDPHAVRDVDRLVGIVDADVHVQAEQQLLARDEARARRRSRGSARARRSAGPPSWANGWVAAEPIVRPFASAVSRTRRRRSSSWPAASPALRHTSVAISSTDWSSSGFTWPSVSRGTASIISSIAETSSIVGVDDHQLLLDPEGVGQALESMVHGPTYTPAGLQQRPGRTSWS